MPLASFVDRCRASVGTGDSERHRRRSDWGWNETMPLLIAPSTEPSAVPSRPSCRDRARGSCHGRCRAIVPPRGLFRPQAELRVVEAMIVSVEGVVVVRMAPECSAELAAAAPGLWPSRSNGAALAQWLRQDAGAGLPHPFGAHSLRRAPHRLGWGMSPPG